MADPTERVTITRRLFNPFTMQVCAVDDATDDEILAACNRDNPAGTTNGWCEVLRAENCSDDSLGRELNKRPLPCMKHPGRTHFLVLC